MDNNETVVHSPGLMGGITGLAKNLFGLVVSRVELAESLPDATATVISQDMAGLA